MTTKERVHRLCVRLARRSGEFNQSQVETIAAAFEPIVERLVEEASARAAFAELERE